MTFVPFPDGALGVIEYGSEDVNWTNTLWFHDLVGGIADYQGLASYLHGWANQHIMPHLSSSYEARAVTVYNMTTSNSPSYTSIIAPVAGSRVGGNAPLSIALVTTFRTGNRGRSGRGRNYVTGFIEDDTGGEQVNNPVIVDGIENAYEVLRLNVQQDVGWYWVVASKYSGGVPRAEVAAQDVTVAEVRSAIFGSQRRRVPRP